MAHKHNRRRIRPRSRKDNNSDPSSLHRLPTSQTVSAVRAAPPNLTYVQHLEATQTASQNSDRYQSPHGNVNEQHSRRMPWQDQEKARGEEAARLEAERVKLFGGEPGEDIALCYRMLEYFSGLDYIDT